MEKKCIDLQEAPKSNEELENHSVLKWTIPPEPFMGQEAVGEQERAWVPHDHRKEWRGFTQNLSQNSCPPPPIHTSLHYKNQLCMECQTEPQKCGTQPATLKGL